MLLNNCGAITTHQLKEFISNKRIYNYVRNGWIEKCNYFHSKNSLEGYKLTKAGINFIEKKFDIPNHYSAQTLYHDSAIAKAYLRLTDEQRNTWITENEIQDRLKKCELNPNQRYSAVDGAYYDSKTQTFVAIEITTCNYGKLEIEAKQNTCEVLEMKYTEIRR